MMDAQAARIVDAWARPGVRVPTEQVAARLFLPMLLEATRVLEEKRVGGPAEVDLGVIFGLGFPAARGGLLYWADSLRPERIIELLAPLESLGPRACPTPLLLEMARCGGRFYG